MNEQLHEERRSGSDGAGTEDHEKGQGMTEQTEATTPEATDQDPEADAIATQEDRPGRRESIQITDVELADDVQSRVAINEVAVKEFAKAMDEEAEFPPIVVFHDGDTYWCADGFHRVRAALQAGKESIAAEVRAGGKEDAILHSVGANATHGIRRTNKDKRRAVEILLQHKVWGTWGARDIARRAGVTHPTVLRAQKELKKLAQGGKIYHPEPDPERGTTTDDAPGQSAEPGETDADEPDQRDRSDDAPSPLERDDPARASVEVEDDEQHDSTLAEPEAPTDVLSGGTEDDFRAAVDRLVESTVDTVEELAGQVANGSSTQEDVLRAMDDAIRRMLEVLSSGKIRIKQAGDAPRDDAKEAMDA